MFVIRVFEKLKFWYSVAKTRQINLSGNFISIVSFNHFNVEKKKYSQNTGKGVVDLVNPPPPSQLLSPYFA